MRSLHATYAYVYGKKAEGVNDRRGSRNENHKRGSQAINESNAQQKEAHKGSASVDKASGTVVIDEDTT